MLKAPPLEARLRLNVLFSSLRSIPLPSARMPPACVSVPNSLSSKRLVPASFPRTRLLYIRKKARPTSADAKFRTLTAPPSVTARFFSNVQSSISTATSPHTSMAPPSFAELSRNVVDLMTSDTSCCDSYTLKSRWRRVDYLCINRTAPFCLVSFEIRPLDVDNRSAEGVQSAASSSTTVIIFEAAVIYGHVRSKADDGEASSAAFVV